MPQIRRLESSHELFFSRGLKHRRVRSLKLNLAGNRGWPDRVVLIKPGLAVFVELKRVGEKLRPLQRARQSELLELGFSTIEAIGRDGVEHALQLIDKLIGQHNEV